MVLNKEIISQENASDLVDHVHKLKEKSIKDKETRERRYHASSMIFSLQLNS